MLWKLEAWIQATDLKYDVQQTIRLERTVGALEQLFTEVKGEAARTSGRGGQDPKRRRPGGFAAVSSSYIDIFCGIVAWRREPVRREAGS